MVVDRTRNLVAMVLLCLAASVSAAVAQSTDDELLPARPMPIVLLQLPSDPPMIVVSDERIQEAERWARDFAEWQAWTETWLNRRQPGVWNNYLDRTKKPDPPVWLDDVCQLLGNDEQFERPCELLVTWREDPLITKERRKSVTALKQLENPTKTVWWQHVHIDGLWSTTQSNVSAFGLFGAHVTVDVVGRLQTFLTPGILLVSVPGLYGNREVWPATDFGVTYRLFNVGRNTVHFNLVHAWMFGGAANLLHANMTLAGFSVSFRRVDADKRRN